MFLILAVVAALSPLAADSATSRPRHSGLPHFFQVNERLYRGAQPKPEGWAQLAKLGVKTVIDLRQRTEHSCEAESLAVYEAGMRYVSFPMNGFATPTNGQIESFLNLLDDDAPAFVHCKLGRDRTGTVVAAYRIARDKWTNEKARAEAIQCGMQWYSKGMKRFISSYRLDDTPAATPPGVTAEAAMAPGN